MTLENKRTVVARAIGHSKVEECPDDHKGRPGNRDGPKR
jgi:hypothetical protein